jgi:hypothetical protein
MSTFFLNFLSWLWMKIKQPAAWAGLGIFCGSLATQLPWPTLDKYLGIIAIVCGAISIALKQSETPQTTARIARLEGFMIETKKQMDLSQDLK